MANLLIKEVPKELLAKVGYLAKISNQTQREFVIQVLEEKINGRGEGGVARDGVRMRGSTEVRPKRPEKRQGVEAVRGAHDEGGPSTDGGAVDGGIPKDSGGKGEGEKRCPQHGEVMADFGNAWFCKGGRGHKIPKGAVK